MELEFNEGRIRMERVLSSLDKLVVRFTDILKKSGVDYVIISGYVPILFGRSRETEDIDIFIEEMGKKRFEAFWEELSKNGFECINAADATEALEEYLQNKLALRFALKGSFIPNFEVKFPKTELNRYSLKNKVVVELGRNRVWISKLELQIAYKLFLGSDKDMEDAAYLWSIFKERMDKKLFMEFVGELKVTDKLKEME